MAARTRNSYRLQEVDPVGSIHGFKHREHRSRKGRKTGYQGKRVARLMFEEKLNILAKKDIE